MIADRVLQTTIISGTGNYTFAETVLGYRTFGQVFSNNDPVYYCATDGDGRWETGIGTYLTASGGQIGRNAANVLSSAGPGQLINWPGGDISKNIFCTVPAAGIVYKNGAGAIVGADATDALRGSVELATNAEVQAGADAVRAVTPAGLASRTATETRTGIAELATNAEVQTGTDTSRIVTPAGLASRTATETRTGIAELATVAEVQAGSDTVRIVTPAGLAGRTATETRTGIAELATAAEVQTGSDTSRIVTPAGLQAKAATTAELLAGTLATRFVTPSNFGELEVVLTAAQLGGTYSTGSIRFRRLGAFVFFDSGANIAFLDSALGHNSDTNVLPAIYRPSAGRVISVLGTSTLSNNRVTINTNGSILISHFNADWSSSSRNNTLAPVHGFYRVT